MNNCSFIGGNSTVNSASTHNLLDTACGTIDGMDASKNNQVNSAYTVANTLESLADNGCITPAGINSACVQTRALKAGSDAINAGLADGINTDQRGFAHVGIADIGAFEFNGSAITNGSCGAADGVGVEAAPQQIYAARVTPPA